MTKPQINYINSMEVDVENATPMIKQFCLVKRDYQGVLLLYRMGDFYEAFFEDAVLLSKELQITLTSREAGALGRIPMAGIPVKAIDNYVPKLLEKNIKIAICEQLEDPSTTKGLVKRDVVRTITAGTIIEENLLNSTKNNYLAAIVKEKSKEVYGFSYCDISTGEFKVTTASYEQLLSELSRIKPSEIIAPTLQQKVLPFQIVPEEKINLPDEIIENYNCSGVSASSFEENTAKSTIEEFFNATSLDSFGFSDYKTGFFAAGAIIQYIIKTQKGNLPRFDVINPYNLDEYMSMDANTRRNLELTQTSKDKSKYGSLFWAIDRTNTNMGARLLQNWINQPLKNIDEIEKRQDAVEELLSSSKTRLELKNLLEKVQDIQRLSSKISNNSVNARDYLALKATLILIPHFNEALKDFSSKYFDVLKSENTALMEFTSIIEQTINEDAPTALKEGKLIKEGVNGELDYLNGLLSGKGNWLNDFEQSEKDRTGIRSLRVGFSKTFGYFIEVTNSNLDSVPDHYIRRQTLTNAERFITEELKKHEQEVLTAQSKSIELEYKIFSDFREYSKEFIEPIREVAQAISTLDTLLSFAFSAQENKYVRPKVTNSCELFIKQGRHPVLEKILPLGKYVSNDLELVSGGQKSQNPQFMILTGPNMAGKSTFMRQNALITILAQIGSYVPADEAKIGVADKIFTRVGAVDDLSLGQSTFMVEMTETAYILNSATDRSLILLDEIGRGTSTYDGVAIAWSVSKYIAENIQARTIFATHYHELNVMADNFPQIKNYRVTISETEGKIEFLRKVVEGSASKSYGIQVAKMAGLPSSVVETAEDLMVKMQKKYSHNLSSTRKTQSQSDIPTPQLTFTFD